MTVWGSGNKVVSARWLLRPTFPTAFPGGRLWRPIDPWLLRWPSALRFGRCGRRLQERLHFHAQGLGERYDRFPARAVDALLQVADTSDLQSCLRGECGLGEPRLLPQFLQPPSEV